MKIILSYLLGAFTTACWFVGLYFCHLKNADGSPSPIILVLGIGIMLTILAIGYLILKATDEQ
jgi:hypothetical protein